MKTHFRLLASALCPPTPALRLLASVLCLLTAALCPSAFAQGTAFTYQGRLNDGANPATGIYDLRFTIYDSTNSPGVVIAGPLTNSTVGVSSGLFAVTLDFGGGPFSNGAPRWLELAVRTNGAGAFASLSPRQPLNPSPYALYAGRVSAAGINGTLPGASLAGSYGASITFSNAANNFTGSGAGLTALNASQLISGTVPDARLSSNVALRNTTNTFTGNQSIVSGNLAVGTNVAGARLEVAGQIKITGGSPGTGKVLTSDNAGLANWTAQPTIARVVTVDAAGDGDYTTISAALAAINPSATNPYVVFVRPGTYVERVVLKSHVQLKGAGQDLTFLKFDPTGATNNFGRATIGLDHLTNVMISGFTLLSYTNAPVLGMAIYDDSSSPVIVDNLFNDLAGALFGLGENLGGIYSTDSSPVIQRNVFTNRFWPADCIRLHRSSALITENVFTPLSPGLRTAVVVEQSSMRFLANVVHKYRGCDINQLLATNDPAVTVAFNQFEDAFFCVQNHGRMQFIGNSANSSGLYNYGPAVISANAFTNCSIHERSDTSTSFVGNTLQGNSGSFMIEDSSPAVTGNYFDNVELHISGSPVISGNRMVLADVIVTSGTPIFSGNDDTFHLPFTGTATIAGIASTILQVVGSNFVVRTPGTFDVRGKLNVTNTATFASDVLAAGDLTVSGNLNVSGTIGGTFASLHGGSAQFTNNVSAGSLNVTGSATFNSLVSANLLDVSGPATFDSLVSAAVFTGDGSALTGIHSLDAADGSPTDALFVSNSGKVGIGLTNPLHRLHVGTTLGTNAFNASTNVVAIEDAQDNGRATFLALAGIGGPDTTNRVEVQIEAVESTRRGIIGTTTEHPVYLRVGNSDTMVLATSRFVGIGTNAPAERLHVIGNILATGTITPNSDRNAKTDVKPVDVAAILERVATLPIQQWRFKTESDQVKHVGPMAQDFRAAFGLGAHETAIATVDADGVALAAIQGLNQKLTEELKRRDAENAELKQRLATLEKLIFNRKSN